MSYRFFNVGESLLGFVSGILGVLLFASFDKLAEVFVFGLLGGVAGMIAKLSIDHFAKMVSRWQRDKKLTDEGALARRRFWKNTVFITIMWILIFVVVLLSILLLIKIY